MLNKSFFTKKNIIIMIFVVCIIGIIIIIYMKIIKIIKKEKKIKGLNVFFCCNNVYEINIYTKTI